MERADALCSSRMVHTGQASNIEDKESQGPKDPNSVGNVRTSGLPYWGNSEGNGTSVVAQGQDKGPLGCGSFLYSPQSKAKGGRQDSETNLKEQLNRFFN